MKLYDYVDILEFLNLIIIISVFFMNIIIYKISKNKIYVYFMIVYFIDVIYFTNKLQISFYYMIVPILIKLGLMKLYKNELKIKISSLKLVLGISVLISINLINSYQNTLILYILLNLVIVKIYIINYIKKLEIKVKKEKQKLKMNRKYINSLVHKKNIECDLQKQYKNEILDLNQQINKSIEKSANPIFILNNKKEKIYSNKEFEEIINKTKFKSDIFLYLKSIFINGDEIIKSIKNIKTSYSETVKSYDGKIYKFVCVKEIINNEYVVVCILKDITESTLIKNKLKESEERCKKLMDILNDGVIIHDMDTVNYINNKSKELFNISKNKDENIDLDDINKNIMKKFIPVLSNNINLVKLGKKEKTITKIETKQGKHIEFITTNVALNNTNMLLSIAIDISDLENAITDIEQSQKTYKLLLETLPEGIVIIDKKTNNYIYRNKAMIRILKNIGVEKLNNIIKEYPEKYEYGKFKKFSINKEEIGDIDIAIINRKEENTFLVVVRILDEKYKTERMKEILDEISEKCKFKTEFLANVANDIKKPINTIFETNKILYLNKDECKHKYIDSYTKLVKQNCYRLMRLLDNLQQIGNLENGNYTMNIKKYDIVKLIENLVEKSSKYTNEKGLNIEFESNVNEKMVIIDKEKIEKVILNILSNSIKFTDKGGKIVVSTIVENKKIFITIKDNGVGIPEDKIDIIFESFEQVDRTLSRGTEGSGIGLSLVKKLIDAHNAKIDVKSKVNKGSEFTIILEDNLHENELMSDVVRGNDFSDNEKIDIEFSDIYFNYSC